MAETCLTEYSERTSVVVTVNFIDEDGDPVAPTSATYRIDDKASKTNILPATPIPAPSTSEDLLITEDQNQILRTRKPFEIRTITVEWNYTSVLGAMHGTAEYEYKIINLYGVVTVPSSSVSPSASASPSA